MTVYSKVKGTLATTKTIQAEFSRLAQLATDQQTQKIFHECMEEMDAVIQDLHHRVEFMKAEEQQYKNS